MMFLRSLLATVLIVAGVSSAALAQERPGSLTITVYDTTGAAIAAANVNLTKPDGTVDQQLADEKGIVTFQGARCPASTPRWPSSPGSTRMPRPS